MNMFDVVAYGLCLNSLFTSEVKKAERSGDHSMRSEEKPRGVLLVRSGSRGFADNGEGLA
jgi:hypothetical protein